jgi:hypothetical protein
MNLVMPIVSAAIAAVVSVLVVFLTRRSETLKQLQSVKAAAYVDFIRGVAGLAILQRESIKSSDLMRMELEKDMLVADAKARIAIYGTERVVSSMARFLRGGAVLDSQERTGSFVAICQEMRNDRSPEPGKVTDHDVHLLLFGSGS